MNWRNRLRYKSYKVTGEFSMTELVKLCLTLTDRAMIACDNNGHEMRYDFAEVSKIVEAGAISKAAKDYELTRFACY